MARLGKIRAEDSQSAKKAVKNVDHRDLHVYLQYHCMQKNITCVTT